MTTLRDLLTDIVKEASEIKEKATERQKQQLDDDMQSLEEIEEEMQASLVEEYMATILVRLIGK